MKRPKLNKGDELRRLMTRSDERLLLFAVMAFQCVCMLLLAFKDETVNVFSLRMALLLPAGTFLGLLLLKKLWPVDRALYILTAYLCGLGVITMRAALLQRYQPKAVEQAKMLLVGYAALLIGVFLVRVFTGREKLIAWAAPPCVLALLVPLAMPSTTGAHNWIYFGSFQFQPSEIVKAVLVFFLAAGFSGGRRIRAWIYYAAAAAVMCGCLVLEKDLGTMALFFATTVAMFAVGTGKKKLVVCCCAAAGAVCFAVLKNIDKIPQLAYLAERIRVWQDPWTNDAYQIVQGLLSIASGGPLGAGLGLSSAGKVPIMFSDYIFAGIAEEFGMIFAISVLAVYIVILIRGMSIAMSARTRFHSLLAFGCTFELIMQMLLIVMGDLKLIPLTGVTLPFVSEGGSSLVSCMLLMGMLLGVSGINAKDEYDDYTGALSPSGDEKTGLRGLLRGNKENRK